MTIKKLRRKMKFKKTLLNKLLLFINPTNKFIVYLSESLDKDVSKYQRHIYKYYKRHNRRFVKKRRLVA